MLKISTRNFGSCSNNKKLYKIVVDQQLKTHRVSQERQVEAERPFFFADPTSARTQGQLDSARFRFFKTRFLARASEFEKILDHFEISFG